MSRRRTVKKGDDVPDGYVVVEDVAAIRLTSLPVLIERVEGKSSLGGWKAW